jgi:hypothetical protein
MSTKHTPGPWELSDHFTVYKLNEDRRRANIFWATVYAGNQHGTVKTERSEVAANARLIAAAPDLLEALQAVREWAEGSAENYTGDHPVAKARAAIAKATEEQQ